MWRWMPFTVLIAMTVVAPWCAPHAADQPVVFPYAAPESGAPLGGDQLGRDVWSRFLGGGRELVLLALCIAVLVTGLSAMLGAAAALYRRLGAAIEWCSDVLILVPPVLGVLIVMLAFPELGIGTVVLVALVFGTPYCTKVFAAAASQITVSGYVEAATGYGESGPGVILREILPNLRRTLAVQFGLRFVAAMYVVGAAAFLDLPALGDTNWAVMIRESAGPGMALNPWSVLAPTAGIIVLTLGMWLSIRLVTGRWGLQTR